MERANNMLKVFLTAVIFLSFSLISYSQEIKKVKITDVEEYIKKSDHPLVVSFWATWCAPCVEEIPWLQETVEKHKADKVELVLVSLDFATYYPAKVTDFIKKRNFKATFFWLNETDADVFCPKIDSKWDGAIPATLLVNNKTGYRKFFGRQLTDRQVGPEIDLLVK
jgi:thiol-disulfide isomerase/thioredoxin